MVINITFNMNESKPNEEQSHPLYKIDREHVDRLLSKHSPTAEDLVDLARLLIRYEGFLGAADLQRDMNKTLKLWGFPRESLNKKVQEIWSKGFRPGQSSEDSVGSGFDTSDEVGN